MGMSVGKAKEAVLELIEHDIRELDLTLVYDRASPDKDPAKFLLAEKPARVIHPWDGFYAKINRGWFNGGQEEPEIKGGPFHWYVFALEGPRAGRINSYYICDYMQLRRFVLDFQPVKGSDYQDQSTWRGEIHDLGNSQGYFRWGDEPVDNLINPSRSIKLRNIADLEDGLLLDQELLGPWTPELSDLLERSQTFTDLQTTERDSIVKSRLGQGRFRQGVIRYWKSCAVTGCDETSLLCASHIKPWRDASNKERLDPHNGLLLSPNLDAAFDAGLISFDDQGRILISDRFVEPARGHLGIHLDMRLRKVDQKHLPYLQYHRDHVFRRPSM